MLKETVKGRMVSEKLSRQECHFNPKTIVKMVGYRCAMTIDLLEPLDLFQYDWAWHPAEPTWIVLALLCGWKLLEIAGTVSH